MIWRHCLRLGFSVGLAGSALAEPAMTGAPVTMHAAASGKSRVVQRIPANAEIYLSKCKHGWCYASWRNLIGYIPADVVVLGPPPVPLPDISPPPPVAYALPTYVTPPVWSWSGPYAGFGLGSGWNRW